MRCAIVHIFFTPKPLSVPKQTNYFINHTNYSDISYIN